MSVRYARTLVAVFLAAYAVAVTWPGMVPFNRIRPLVLGLPFSMVWIALWIVAGGLALWALDRAEAAARRRRAAGRAPETPDSPAGE